MNLEHELLGKVRMLPSEQKREVIDLVNRLQQAHRVPKRGKSLAGLWSKYDIALSQDDIQQARHHMWSTFPRHW